MNRNKLFALASLALVGLAVVVGSIATADPAADSQSALPPDFKLPKGWTMEDVQACMIAGTPGKEHEHLAKDVGEWRGKTTMWMGAESEPMTSECTMKVEKAMDGRYTKAEMAGEMPGMGPYSGFGLSGFDNISREFVSTWIDNHSTGIMYGKGKLSDDGKTLTWEFTHNCPITKKPTVMREVDTTTGPNSKTLEMFGADPKSGKEYKMMRIELTRK
jgi:hypothetical protein